MRKITLLIGGVAALAAVWTGGWHAGKAFIVTPEADRAVENLRAGDLFFSYQAREIGGFPFGYDVAYRGVEISAGAGWRWSAPQMSIGSGVANVGELVVTPSPESRLAIDAAAFGAGDDAPVVMDIASEGLTLTLSDRGETFALAATALTATQTPGGTLLRDGALEFSELAFGGRLAADRAAADVALTAAKARIAYRLSVDGVTESRSDTVMNDVAATFAGDELSADDFADFVRRGGEGRFSMTIGAYESDGGTSGGPSAAPMAVTVSGVETSADVAVADGRAAYRASAGAMKYNVELEAPPPFAGGAFAIGGARASLEFPVAKAAAAAPYAMLVDLKGVALGEEIWAAFDPAAAIDRTPLDVNLDIGGDARVIFELGEDSFGQAPLDVETMEIRNMSISGLGASAVASGELEIAGDASRPDGNVHIELRGALALLDKLVAAGLLPPQQGVIFRSMALGLARQGDEPDHLIADIEAANGAVSVNGQRLQ